MIGKEANHSKQTEHQQPALPGSMLSWSIAVCGALMVAVHNILLCELIPNSRLRYLPLKDKGCGQFLQRVFRIHNRL
jgi:hypothetical protein